MPSNHWCCSCFRRWSICRPNLTLLSSTMVTQAWPSTPGLSTVVCTVTPGPWDTTEHCTPRLRSWSRRSSLCQESMVEQESTTPPCITRVPGSLQWPEPTLAWAPTQEPTLPLLSTPSSILPMVWMVSRTWSSQLLLEQSEYHERPSSVAPVSSGSGFSSNITTTFLVSLSTLRMKEVRC